ncbi:hypothetical protein SCLCIDRAFT_24203 [Scleroderma citrinum Foug A]|uniref:Uncharacterized protein n=1 Tax=Scleroderma citrinum Foug A TaxID=1036808 RepID=A0A0C3AF04_9AGAM|nr:hypothetical protein SCLCIDRAFT_24203 [Scleroderma citrinum Foug A]
MSDAPAEHIPHVQLAYLVLTLTFLLESDGIFTPPPLRARHLTSLYPPYPLERANNLLGFLMNKTEKHAFLNVSLSSQMRTISLGDVMNQKSIGNATKRRTMAGAAMTKKTHGVDAVPKSFPIQRVTGNVMVTTQRIPVTR